MSVVEKTSEVVAADLAVSAVVVRFAGDSGDGMQLTGSNFTEATALHGNDLATFPDFGEPAGERILDGKHLCPESTRTMVFGPSKSGEIVPTKLHLAALLQ